MEYLDIVLQGDGRVVHAEMTKVKTLSVKKLESLLIKRFLSEKAYYDGTRMIPCVRIPGVLKLFLDGSIAPMNREETVGDVLRGEKKVTAIIMSRLEFLAAYAPELSSPRVSMLSEETDVAIIG